MTNDEDRSIGLGDHVEEFKPMMGNIIAGFILSILLVLGGLAAVGFPLHAAYEADWNLPFNVKKGWSWLAVGVFSILGIGLVVGGVLLSASSRRRFSRYVVICKNSFRDR